MTAVHSLSEPRGAQIGHVVRRLPARSDARAVDQGLDDPVPLLRPRPGAMGARSLGPGFDSIGSRGHAIPRPPAGILQHSFRIHESISQDALVEPSFRRAAVLLLVVIRHQLERPFQRGDRA